MRFKSSNRFSEIKKNVTLAAGGVLLLTAGDILVDAASNAPVDSGDLRDSYLKDSAIEVVSDTSVTLGSDIEYAEIQEFGGRFTDAQPHFIPAAETNRKKFKQRAKEAVEKAIK